MDSSVISQPRLKDDGFHVTYDDEDDTYVVYRPDFTYPISFQRDKGGTEFYISPNITKETYDGVINVNQLNVENRLHRFDKKSGTRAVKAQND